MKSGVVSSSVITATGRMDAEYHLIEDQPHESGGDRYAIYAVHPHWTHARTVDHADGRKRLAETSLDGIGLCLRTLREEGDLTNDSRVGILDRQDRTWLINPWAKGD